MFLFKMILLNDILLLIFFFSINDFQRCPRGTMVATFSGGHEES